MFYKSSDLDRKLLHNILKLNDPSVFADLMDKIGKVQSIDPLAKDTYYGFYINDIYEAESFYSKKHKTPEERLRYLLKKVKECNEKFSDSIKTAFKAVLNFSPFKKEGIDPLYPKDKLTKGPKAFFALIEDYNLRNRVSSEDITDKVLSEFESLILNLPFNNTDNVCFTGNTKAEKHFKNKTLTLKFESVVKDLKQQVQRKMESLEVLYAEISFNIAVTMHRRFKEICSSYNVISLDQVLFELAECLCTSAENETQRERAENLSALLRRRYPVALIDEFQDTDPIQFEIFNSIYFKDTSKDSVCYLIGDPKQSIYRFRGSDINSYNKAKEAIDAKKGKRYELPTNYRSASAIVEGVNAIFRQEPGPQEENKTVSPDYPYLPNAFNYDSSYQDSNISFSPAGYDPKKEGTGIFFEDDKTTLINNKVVNLKLELEKNNNIKSDTLRKVVARATAINISECLNKAYFSDSKKEENSDSKTEDENKKKVLPGDIAVLVRTGKESQEIINALKELNIPAVYYSDKSSVLFEYDNTHGVIERKPSEAALNIVYLMEAICNYTKKDKIARLFGSSLISPDFDEFKKVINEDKIDEEIQLLSECLKKWESFGFATAFFYFLMKKELFSRIMSLDSGERALTDYIHISEIIQTQHGKILGAKSQLLWFKDMLFSSENDYYDSDFEKKRLESEKSLVKIYTIHSSKGLQFPLVFLPYLYNKEGSMDDSLKSLCGSSRKIYTYYDPKQQHLAITLNKDYPVQVGNDTITAENIVKRETMQENVRLAYVALT
ncbi:UvrD-helicase domain-containing protein, partial [uncultured Succinivibrio sp.]|uniref:UvrD-helicase domain-containing protein n=1 Tax=uncultured Succinivibrio sp. TaxID=540749 RepID=UPI0025E5EA69